MNSQRLEEISSTHVLNRGTGGRLKTIFTADADIGASIDHYYAIGWHQTRWLIVSGANIQNILSAQWRNWLKQKNRSQKAKKKIFEVRKNTKPTSAVNCIVK